MASYQFNVIRVGINKVVSQLVGLNPVLVNIYMQLVFKANIADKFLFNFVNQ